MSNCARCFHPKENHVKVQNLQVSFEKDPQSFSSHICTGSIDCICQHFEEPVLMEFAQEVEANKANLKTKYARSKYILSKLPPTRNAGSKTFYKIYNEIWHGIKIRNNCSMELTPELWKRLPVSSSVNRAKRFVKADHPELKTYDPKMLFHQTALYQAIVEMAAEA